MKRSTAAPLVLTIALALVPWSVGAQHARPSLRATAAAPTAGRVDETAARSSSLTLPSAPVERRGASAARHAGIGALSGLVAGTIVVAWMGYTYGTGYSSIPVVMIAVVTAGGATVGALGGLAVSGVKRLARRD